MTDHQGDPKGPERLGRYELLTRIAAGGMAEVFVARVRGEGGFERMVAVKRMLPTIAEEEHFAEMFLDEGRIAGQIESPNVVQILDVGRADSGELFIAMDLVRGLPLHRLLSLVGRQKQFLPVPIAVAILVQAAEGLGAAHQATSALGEPLGIVHRDVSPQNLLVGIDGRVRVADFGVARAVHRRTSTSTGELKGKLAYFAPEQLRSKPATAASDVFAMGVVAWEAFAMQRLFQGESPVDTIEKIRNMVPTPLDQLRDDVPAELAAVINRALDKDPARRTESARRFAAELREAYEPADASTLARFVRSWGEEEMRSLDDRIRAAIAGRIESTSQDIVLPIGEEDDRSGVRHADEATTVTPPHPVDVRSGGAPPGVPRSRPAVGKPSLPAAQALPSAAPSPGLEPGTSSPVFELVSPKSTPSGFTSVSLPSGSGARNLPLMVAALGALAIAGFGVAFYAFRPPPAVEVHSLPTVAAPGVSAPVAVPGLPVGPSVPVVGLISPEGAGAAEADPAAAMADPSEGDLTGRGGRRNSRGGSTRATRDATGATSGAGSEDRPSGTAVSDAADTTGTEARGSTVAASGGATTATTPRVTSTDSTRERASTPTTPATTPRGLRGVSSFLGEVEEE